MVSELPVPLYKPLQQLYKPPGSKYELPGRLDKSPRPVYELDP